MKEANRKRYEELVTMKNLSKLPNFRWCAGDDQKCGSGQIPSGSKSTPAMSQQTIDDVKARIQNGSAANVKYTTVSIARRCTTRSRPVNSINALRR